MYWKLDFCKCCFRSGNIHSCIEAFSDGVRYDIHGENESDIHSHSPQNIRLSRSYVKVKYMIEKPGRRTKKNIN